MRSIITAFCFSLPVLAWLSAVPLRAVQPIAVGGAIAELGAGNQRFVRGEPSRLRRDIERREQLAAGQHPFAVIVGCSDSRVPPELIFDQGLGDLFVIRIAGNVVDDGALASIEYAVEHLGAQLIVVLGHERCGAVAAVVGGGHLGGHLETLANAIRPAVDAAKLEHPTDLLDAAVVANVQRVVRQLTASQPVLAEYRHKGLEIVGARYDLDSGAVEFNPRASRVPAPVPTSAPAPEHAGGK
jgi:carbonic anhydrase